MAKGERVSFSVSLPKKLVSDLRRLADEEQRPVHLQTQILLTEAIARRRVAAPPMLRAVNEEPDPAA